MVTFLFYFASFFTLQTIWAAPNFTANALNLSAGSMVIYEVQARAANACDPNVGASWQKESCRRKVAPVTRYRSEDPHRCSDSKLAELSSIRLGTLDDLLENSTDYHVGITLRYIKEKVGATTVWLMPLFPNNDRWSLPDPCDNLGSPYSVRDYLHVKGELDRFCIAAVESRAGAVDYLPENGKRACWGNGAMDKVIAQAHKLGLKVMLDVALNHFGHNYLFYDYARFTPVRERIARGENLEDLWDFSKTVDWQLVNPEVLDTPEKLVSHAANDPLLGSALAAVQARCPQMKGDELVRAVSMWRVMLDWERQNFRCDQPVFLEHSVPGFYLGARASGVHPSRGIGDNFTNEWRDVKFLFHHQLEANTHEFARNREYLFRVLNYWISRGVDGFRLDHTTDVDSGMSPSEWKYLLSKVNYYDWLRKGRPWNHVPPVYLAEEFADQEGMRKVSDIMIDGYVFDMNGRASAEKGASHVEWALRNGDRHGDRSFVLRALETHDEHRLTDGTGFNVWTGAGFWGIGATTRGTPMLLMGQEFGEPWGLGFRRSDFLRSRFYGTPHHQADGAKLVDYYRTLNQARLDPWNSALLSHKYEFLRTWDHGKTDERIFAQVKWDPASSNVFFVFHNLWEQGTLEQSYFISPELAQEINLRDDRWYRLVDVLQAGRQVGGCTRGADLKWRFPIRMSQETRAQWLRLEACQ